MRIDNGMVVRNSPDLSRTGYSFKDRILLVHHARDHVLGKTPFVVEQLDTIPAVNAVSIRGITTVQLHRVFSPDTVLLGFGMPNVFLAKVVADDPAEGDPVARFDAKSLYREKSKIVYNRNGNDQAGFYIVPNLTREEDDHVMQVARSEVGKSHKTCCYAVSSILHKAGFAGEDGRDVRRTWPTDLLEFIVNKGLRLNDRKVDFMVVSAVPDTLAEYLARVRKAQYTPVTRRLLAIVRPISDAGKIKRAHDAKNMQMDDKYYRRKPSFAITNEFVSSSSSFEIQVSNPSALGLIFRKAWGSHSIYRRTLNDDEERLIRKLFPSNLVAYAVADDLQTKIKKHILFSQFVRRLIASHHQPKFVSKSMFSVADVLDLMPHSQTYNFVLTPKSFAITAVTKGAASWVLSKHLLLAEGSVCRDEVKMAGEIRWEPNTDGARPRIFFNDRSGTYRPGQAQLEAFAQLLRAMYPGAGEVMYITLGVEYCNAVR